MKLSKMKDYEIVSHSLKFLFISKNIISILSVLGGIFYLNVFISKSINYNIISMIISVVILCSIEIMSVLLMLYSFSFLFRKKYYHFVPFFLMFMFFYSVSFFSTVNGLGYWINEKQNITTTIEAEYNDFKSDLSDSLYKQHLFYKNLSDSLILRPHAKYVTERNMEQKRIDIAVENSMKYLEMYNYQIALIESKHSIDIEKANTEIANYSEKYYIFGMLIMVLLVFFNFMYAYYDYYVQNRTIESDSGLTNEKINKLWKSGQFKTKKDLASHLGTNQAKITRATKY